MVWPMNGAGGAIGWNVRSPSEEGQRGLHDLASTTRIATTAELEMAWHGEESHGRDSCGIPDPRSPRVAGQT